MMTDQQYVSLVAQGGTPVRLTDQRGAPYPTTGSGALVFANGPTITNALLINPTIANLDINTMPVVATKLSFELSFVPVFINKIYRLAFSESIEDGGTIWTHVGSEPTHPGKMRSLNGAWFELTATRVNPAMFGGPAYPYNPWTWDPTGKLSASQGIADAFAFMAATGAIIDHPGVIYIAEDTVTGVPNVVNNIGTMTFDGSRGTKTTVNGAPCLRVLRGTPPTVIGNLTADVAVGANVFPLDAFAVTPAEGGIVVMESNRQMSSAGVTSRSAQPLTVKTVDTGTNTVTTWEGVWNDYPVSDGSKLLSYDTRTRWNITGTLTMYGGGRVAAELSTFSDWTFGNTINTLTSINVQRGFATEFCSLNTYIDTVNANGVNIDATLSDAVGLVGNYNFRVRQINADRVRHAFNNNPAPSTHRYWCGDNWWVGGFTATNMYGCPMNSHPGTGRFVFGDGPVSYATNATSASGQVAVGQGAGMEGGTITVIGKCYGNALAFEPYGWNVPGYIPSAHIAGLIMEQECAGNVVNLQNRTNQSGTFTPQRANMVVDYMNAKGVGGARAISENAPADLVINGGQLTSREDLLDVSCRPDSRATITTNNMQLNYLGTSTDGIHSSVNTPGSSTESGSITVNGGQYTSARNRVSGATDVLIVFNGTKIVTPGTPTFINAASGGLTYCKNAGGYTAMMVGAVTQATDKSTGVTSNFPVVNITMNAANLAAASPVVPFTLANTYIAAGDSISVVHVSGGTAGAYAVSGSAAAIPATITVRNISGGDLAEAIVLRVVVTKASTLA